jgi:hypothetical protein
MEISDPGLLFVLVGSAIQSIVKAIPLPRRVGFELGLLSSLARLLPTSARARFVAEAQGNLGDCERWWQRIDVLVCLALGMPRLAWMLHHENRRDRAR